jgi:hypothetical protein
VQLGGAHGAPRHLARREQPVPTHRKVVGRAVDAATSDLIAGKKNPKTIKNNS